MYRWTIILELDSAVWLHLFNISIIILVTVIFAIKLDKDQSDLIMVYPYMIAYLLLLITTFYLLFDIIENFALRRIKVLIKNYTFIFSYVCKNNYL